ncbi:MAG TPA: non-ribosomal peptide synthetase [Alphaproteobacteria bacterium]
MNPRDSLPADPASGTVCDAIRRWAELRPDAPAFVAEDREPLTYGGLARVMERFGAALDAAGLGRGDRIAIVHPGGPDMASALAAVVSCAVAVPQNPGFTAGEFAIHLRDRRISALLLPAGLETPARAAAAHLGLPVLEVESAPAVAGDIRLAAIGDGERRGTFEPVTGDDLAVVLATAGTSARSKVVPKRHRHVRFMARMIVDSCALSPEDRVLLLQPLIYSSGFHLLMSALLSGGSVIFMPEFDVDTFFRYLARLGPTWVTGSHTFHRAIHAHAARYPEAIAKSRLRLLRTSSGFLQSRIADDLERIFGVPVLENYGSTEASRLTANPLPPGRAKRGTGGVRLSQEVAIRGLDGRFLPPGEIGEIVARVDRAFEGYEDDPKANAEAFVDGWFRTGDEGFFDEDGYLTLTGRIREMINRGGEKVSPAEVDAAVMAHPDVREAATFPVPHPTLGEDVAVAVVAVEGTVLTDEKLHRHLIGRLAGYKVPRRYLFVESIPKSDAGKVQRYRLAEALGVGGAAAPRRVEGAGREPTSLERRLAGMWARTLGVERVGLDENFFVLGGDSLQAVELFLEIERELGHRLPRAALFEAGTVAEMARLVQDGMPARCLVPIRPTGSRPPFFCVHDGNGHVLNFRDLVRHMGEDQPFYGIQCVGLDGREMPFTDIDTMAAHYVREIRKVQPAGPYFLGGYSFGGRVAYVMARMLRQQGDGVALLALLDTSSHLGRARVGWREWLRRHADRFRDLPPARWPSYIGVRFGNLFTVIAMAARYHFYARVLRFYRSRGRDLPQWLHLPVAANDVIRRDYRPVTYEGSAVLFVADHSAWSHADSRLGWGQLVLGDLEVRRVPGEHFQIVKEPHVRVLAAGLRDCITARMPAVPAGEADSRAAE